MDFESRPWRAAFWAMTWAPLITFVLRYDEWGLAKSLVVGLGVSLGLFAVGLLVGVVQLIRTDYGLRRPEGHEVVSEPPTHVRRLES